MLSTLASVGLLLPKLLLELKLLSDKEEANKWLQHKKSELWNGRLLEKAETSVVRIKVQNKPRIPLM